MESISIGLSSSLTFQNSPKSILPTQTLTHFPKKINLLSNSHSFLCKLPKIQSTHCSKLTKKPNPFLKIQSFCNLKNTLLLGLTFPLPSLAIDTVKEAPNRINLEEILFSIDHFICKLPKIQSTHHSNSTKKPNPYLKIKSFTNLKSSLLLGLTFPLPSLAIDTIEEAPNRINLEAILVSIDEFFNKYPFFVAGVTFIWLVVIPLTEEYLQKYKFISAIDAFRKLRDDPNSELLDIREGKSLRFLRSPNLKILNKNVMQVEFREGEEDGFVKKVLERFKEPSDTTICILDNFDGNSMEVAELLFKNGFKEAYAIRGGVRGKNGWQAIQESLLPPSVHVYPKEKTEVSKEPETNGAVTEKGKNNENVENGYINQANESTATSKSDRRSLSPYPNYPDLKPPSSPTPSKP